MAWRSWPRSGHGHRAAGWRALQSAPREDSLQGKRSSQGADDRGGGQAVHQRHLHIHEHKVKGLHTQTSRASRPLAAAVTWCSLSNIIEATSRLISLSSTTRMRRFLATGPGWLWSTGQVRLSGFAGFKGQRQVEGAALAGLAVHPHGPAHERGQLSADRQPQASDRRNPGHRRCLPARNS